MGNIVEIGRYVMPALKVKVDIISPDAMRTLFNLNILVFENGKLFTEKEAEQTRIGQIGDFIIYFVPSEVLVKDFESYTCYNLGERSIHVIRKNQVITAYSWERCECQEQEEVWEL